MAKSDKATVQRRITEVLKLMLAGGEFDDIRQYATAREWNLSDRQLRRYQEWAYEHVVAETKRDRTQLKGRHLMQRRALFARAVKSGDVRTGLQVLKDEAHLQGLYPEQNEKAGEDQGKPLLSGPPPIDREQRFIRTLTAEAKGDNDELRLMEYLTPDCMYRFTDLQMPRMLLHIITLMYIGIQLDHATMFFMGMWHMQAKNDPDGTWNFVAECHAFRFKLEVDAWDLFTGKLGVDGLQLVRDNHQGGTFLQLFTDRVYELAMEPEAFAEFIEKESGKRPYLPTAESTAEVWWGMLREVLSD